MAASCGGNREAERDTGAEPSSTDDDEVERDGGSGDDNGSDERDASRRRNDGGAEARDDDDDDSEEAPAPKELVTLDDCGANNPAGLSASDVERLKRGTTSGARMLYPYDGTVFPRGFQAPLLMWEGGSGTAAYVRIRSKYFAYDGCLTATAPGRLQLPQSVWETAGQQTLGPSTPFEVAVHTLDGGEVMATSAHEVVIAQATFKGSLYYNSYDSKLGGGLAGTGIGGAGAVLRLRPGQDAEFYVRQAVCTGCHTVSANGQRLISKEIAGLGGAVPGLGMGDGQVYNIGPDSTPNPPVARAASSSAFVALSPDGSVYLSTAVQPPVGPATNGALGALPANATLYETDTGMVVPNSGIPEAASMPTFSADGSFLAYSDLAQGGRAIAIVDYDSSRRTAGNARTIYESGTDFLGWPFLLPDNGGVVFTATQASSFGGNGAYVLGLTFPGPASDLFMADVGSGKGVIMARAMGFATVDDAERENTYLPFGAEELHQNYYPTVSPVAAGGYFWVFFDSIRHYGNLGMHRSLWGTAVAVQDFKGEFASEEPYAVDLSSPAFYVPGQELEGANHRAFAALDPCRADGQDCESGIDCCSGFCSDGVCGPPTEKCSQADEACESDDDCCAGVGRCIGGFCGQVFR